MRRAIQIACAGLAVLPSLASAQEKKEEAVPMIAAFTPFEASPGSALKLRIRGAKLSNATAIEFPGVKVPITAEIKEKKAAEVGNGQDPKRVGDTQVEVELKLPPETPMGQLPFRFVTPEGTTSTRDLVIVDPQSRTEEAEPNNAFREANSLSIGSAVRGVIKDDKDVDVYRITATAGRKISCAIFAAERGSLLDPLLTVFDHSGNIVATADDAGESRDCRSVFTPAADGAYFVSVSDASDRSGAWHEYTLEIREALP